jgi:hypothetical protein
VTSLDLFYFSTNINVQDSVAQIFLEVYPHVPRLHPAIIVIGKEFERAGEAGVNPDFNNFCADAIRNACIERGIEHPEYHLQLNLRTLPSFLSDEDEETFWWLPGETDSEEEESEEEEEGE